MHFHIAHLVLRLKPRNYRGDFVGQITKPHMLVLSPKPKNLSKWFWGQTTRTVSISFEAKLGETVNLGFEAKLRNLWSSSPYARCRSHTTSPDLSIIRPLSTQHVLDHPRSSAPSLLLLPQSSSLPIMPHLSPTHYETSTCISPHETDSRVKPPKFPGFKFKPRQVNYSSQIKPRYSPLGFSCLLVIKVSQSPWIMSSMHAIVEVPNKTIQHPLKLKRGEDHQAT
jgi:hypothetical protein